VKDAFIQDTREIIDNALADLAKPPAPRVVPGVTVAEFLLVLSVKTRLFIEVKASDAEREDADAILLALYEFLDQNPALEEKNIYLTTMGESSMLLEKQGWTLFCEAFRGTVQRSHYKRFHETVRFIVRRFPQIGQWNGDLADLPPGLQESIGEHLVTKAPAGAETGPPGKAAGQGPGPAAGSGLEPIVPPEEPAPDMEYYEKKMRSWYESGYAIEPLKLALHEDLQLIRKAFEIFERNVDRLEGLRKEIEELEFEGFEEEVRRLQGMLRDTRSIQDIERGIHSLIQGVKAKYGIKLPITDRGQMAQAIKSLPLGIPSILWGIPLDMLVESMFASERGLAPDGSVVVRLKGRWFHADPRRTDFMNATTEKIHTERELLQERYKAGQERPPGDIITRILETHNRPRHG